MIRRIAMAMVVLAFCATAAWPKFKEDEQKYLEDQFRAVTDQLQQMTQQIQSLNAQLTELRQNQAQFQAVIVRQQRALAEMDQMVSSMRVGNEDNFSSLRHAITQLRDILKQAGSPPSTGAQITESPAPSQPRSQAPAEPTKGYVTLVQGDVVMVDIGGSAGVHQGSRLAVYKANDPNTSVGVLEVTQVVDAGSSRAKVITMNSGVRPEFSDIVRVQ